MERIASAADKKAGKMAVPQSAASTPSQQASIAAHELPNTIAPALLADVPCLSAIVRTFDAAQSARYRFAGPVPEAELARLEEAIEDRRNIRSFRFPPSYRMLMTRVGDASFSNSCDGGIDLTFEKIESLIKSRCGVREMWDPYLYPSFEPLVLFGGNGCGDLYAFDPRVPIGDSDYLVVRGDHETGDLGQSPVSPLTKPSPSSDIDSEQEITMSYRYHQASHCAPQPAQGDWASLQLYLLCPFLR
jgi:hypothetical protein